MSSAGLLAGALGSPCVGSSTWLLGLPHRMAAWFQFLGLEVSEHHLCCVLYSKPVTGLPEFKEEGIKPPLHAAAAWVCRTVRTSLLTSTAVSLVHVLAERPSHAVQYLLAKSTERVLREPGRQSRAHTCTKVPGPLPCELTSLPPSTFSSSLCLSHSAGQIWDL